MTQATRKEGRGASMVSAVVAAMTVSSATLGAQAPVYGTDVNVAGETRNDRAPVLFGSAYVAPAGARGISVQQAYGIQRDDRILYGAPGHTWRRQFASTLSGYWGLTPAITIGGSVGFLSTEAEYYWDPAAPRAPQEEQSFQSLSRMGVGNLRVFARARVFQTEDRATQVAVNVFGEHSGGGYAEGGRGMGAGAGVAIAQRVGRVNFHVAPTLEVGRDHRPYTEVAGAVVFPLLPRVTGSVEGLYGSGGEHQVFGVVNPALVELGGGLRFDFARLKLDLGYRQSTSPSPDYRDRPRRGRMMLGTHVKF